MSQKQANEQEYLPAPVVTLTRSELDTLNGNLESGDRAGAVRLYQKTTGADLYTAWSHVKSLATWLKSGFATDARSPRSDSEMAGLVASQSRRTAVGLGYLLALIIGLVWSAGVTDTTTWLTFVMPGILFFGGAIVALNIRSEATGAAMLFLGILMLLGSGMAIIGIRDAYPETDTYLYATPAYFIALLLLAAGCGVTLMQNGWKQDDITATEERSDGDIRGRRLARKVARLSVFFTVYTTALVLHWHIIENEMTDRLFNALFRFLLIVPLVGIMAGITTAVAADKLRSTLSLALVPLLSAALASWIFGQGSLRDAIAELVLVQILATLVGFAWIIGRGLGWRTAPLTALGVTIALGLVPALLVGGVASELIQGAVERGLLSGDPKTWIPFVVVVIWVGIDLGGGLKRPAINEAS